MDIQDLVGETIKYIDAYQRSVDIVFESGKRLDLTIDGCSDAFLMKDAY